MIWNACLTAICRIIVCKIFIKLMFRKTEVLECDCIKLCAVEYVLNFFNNKIWICSCSQMFEFCHISGESAGMACYNFIKQHDGETWMYYFPLFVFSLKTNSCISFYWSLCVFAHLIWPYARRWRSTFNFSHFMLSRAFFMVYFKAVVTKQL